MENIAESEQAFVDGFDKYFAYFLEFANPFFQQFTRKEILETCSVLLRKPAVGIHQYAYDTAGYRMAPNQDDRPPEDEITVDAVVGRAFFLQTARFTHSCSADVRGNLNGHTPVVHFRLRKGKMPLTKPFNSLTINTLGDNYALLTTEERRNALKVRYTNRFIDPCACHLCLDVKQDQLKRHGLKMTCPDCNIPLVCMTPSDEHGNHLQCIDCNKITICANANLMRMFIKMLEQKMVHKKDQDPNQATSDIEPGKNNLFFPLPTT